MKEKRQEKVIGRKMEKTQREVSCVKEEIEIDERERKKKLC
jgi:hypothetical protein